MEVQLADVVTVLKNKIADLEYTNSVQTVMINNLQNEVERLREYEVVHTEKVDDE